jgi:hypothetical protein
MLNLTKEIIQKETNYHSNKILAETSHIPESRSGNILRRPVLSDFEIAYLSNSRVPAAYRIRLLTPLKCTSNSHFCENPSCTVYVTLLI